MYVQAFCFSTLILSLLPTFFPPPLLHFSYHDFRALGNQLTPVASNSRGPRDPGSSHHGRQKALLSTTEFGIAGRHYLDHERFEQSGSREPPVTPNHLAPTHPRLSLPGDIISFKMAARTPSEHPDAIPPHPHRILPPNLRGTITPMPARVLQMHPKQLFGPMTIQWYRINNTERLEWALENGFTLQDAKFSMDTGMIVFPGLDDQNFIPKCVRGVTPPNPTETERALWEEFLTALENFSKPPPSWNYLQDLAIRWLTGACLPSRGRATQRSRR
jgi:hypothetical protein